jgi:hypothetical protein
VSGTLNTRVIRRIARFASGWIPWGDEMADPTVAIPRLRESLAALGRDPLSLRVLGSLALRSDPDGRLDLDRTMDGLRSQVEAGITDFLLGGRVPNTASEAAEVLPAVVDAFRSRT